MTRENLLQAIYDNTDDWSCQYTCPHTMEKENPQVVCMECAESLLAEYEQKIRADAIEEVLGSINKLDRFWFADKDENPITPKMVDYEEIQKIAEQLKEQTNESS